MVGNLIVRKPLPGKNSKQKRQGWGFVEISASNSSVPPNGGAILQRRNLRRDWGDRANRKSADRRVACQAVAQHSLGCARDRAARLRGRDYLSRRELHRLWVGLEIGSRQGRWLRRRQQEEAPGSGSRRSLVPGGRR